MHHQDNSGAEIRPPWYRPASGREASYEEAKPKLRKRSAVSLHTLRHTCASLLFDAGLNIKQAQEWLGHADPGFTLRTYVHLMDEGIGDAAFMHAAQDQLRWPGPEGGPLAEQLKRDRLQGVDRVLTASHADSAVTRTKVSRNSQGSPSGGLTASKAGNTETASASGGSSCASLSVHSSKAAWLA